MINIANLTAKQPIECATNLAISAKSPSPTKAIFFQPNFDNYIGLLHIAISRHEKMGKNDSDLAK